MMNREQYLIQLKKTLSSLSEQERDEAMSFYEEYLADLEENDPAKIDTLDPPRQIAAQIKAEVAMKTTQEKDIKKKKGITTAWTVLLAVFALPIGFPVAITVAAIAFSLIVFTLALIFSFFAVAFSLILSSFASLATAVALATTDITVSIFYLGLGLLGLGLVYLMGVAIYDLSKRMFMWIATLINKIRLRIHNRQIQKRGELK